MSNAPIGIRHLPILLTRLFDRLGSSRLGEDLEQQHMIMSATVTRLKPQYPTGEVCLWRICVLSVFQKCP